MREQATSVGLNAKVGPGVEAGNLLVIRVPDLDVDKVFALENDNGR